MNQSTIPIIAIIITIITGLLLFISYDHSGFSVTDCTFEENSNQQDSYNLTYRLLVGRHFNHVECQYVIYSDDNKILNKGNTKLDDVNMGSFPISNNLTLDNDSKVARVEITIYTKIETKEDDVNKTSMEKAYSKSFKL